MNKTLSVALIFALFLFSIGCEYNSVEIEPQMSKGYITSDDDKFMTEYKSSIAQSNVRKSENINWNEIFRVYNPETDITTYTLFKSYHKTGVF